MTPEEFLNNFGVLADSPSGVPKLRRMILELAVRGKLTRQQAEDEPAEALLNQAHRERQELMNGRKTGGRGRNSASSDSVEGSKPYALPFNWTWCTLADVAGHIVDGTHHTPTYVTDGISFISAKDIKRGQITFEGCRMISHAEFNELSKRCHPKMGDILVTKSGSIGEVAVVRTDRVFTLFESVALVPIVPSVDRGYASHVVYLGASGEFGETNRKGVAVQHLHLNDLRRLPFPLPPRAEQKRIVAKVDQLMALCDELEARQTKKRETGTKLTQSALDALTSAEGPEEFAKSWQRVADNFQVLINTPESIGKVRKTILELAVRGTLVRQDPNDEPSSKLLARLATGKGHPATTHRRTAVKSTLTLPELPSLPESWSWAEFGSLLVFGPKNGYSPKGVDYPTQVKSLTLSATTSGRFDSRHFKFIDEPIAPDSDLWLRDGDILIQRGNTIDYVGVAAIYRGTPHEFIHPDLMMKVRIAPLLDLDFFHIALNSSSARKFIQNNATGTAGSMPKINQAVVTSIPVPVPPLAEQKRISARVNHFMALCDTLESKLRDAEQGAQRLAEAMVAEMVA